MMIMMMICFGVLIWTVVLGLDFRRWCFESLLEIGVELVT